MFLNVLDFLKEKKMQSLFFLIFTLLLLRVHQQCWSLSLLPVLSWIPVSGSKISSGLYIWILQPLRKGQWFTELPFEFSNENMSRIYLYYYNVFWCCFEQLQYINDAQS